MSECYISLYGDKAEAFEAAKEQMGPADADPSNAEAVMRLLEAWERERDGLPPGGLRQ